MKVLKSVTALLCLVYLGVLLTGQAFAKDQFSTSPKTNNGKKWRLAYYEGGYEANYYNYLQATVKGLMELGWIESVEIPNLKPKGTVALWNWLASDTKSNYLEFVRDAFYSANWDKSKRQEMRSQVIDKLKKPGECDLILAMGTWGGKDLATSEHAVPTIIMSASDPVNTQIIASIEDSGQDHVHARVDPFRFERQVRVFHDTIGFQKLGVAYEDSDYGRNYAALNLIEKVAKEREFQVVSCHTQSDVSDQESANSSVIKCFKELAPKVDAIYVTQQGGINPQTIPEIVKITNEHRIPTFYQAGAEGVRQGLLMSISRSSFRPVGMFEAANIAKIFNGAKARQLGQFFEESPIIALNLKTAEIIGLYLYADVLAAADELYRDIMPAE